MLRCDEWTRSITLSTMALVWASFGLRDVPVVGRALSRYSSISVLSINGSLRSGEVRAGRVPFLLGLR